MVKVLVSGAVGSQWEVLFERVKKLNGAAKGSPFELLIVLGGVLSLPESYINGERQVPIKTLCILANESQDSEDQANQRRHPKLLALLEAPDKEMEISTNFFYLGKSGVRTISGLNVAFLSGKLASSAADSSAFRYSPSTVQQLQKRVEDDKIVPDFFISAEFAANFQRLLDTQHIPEELQKTEGVECLKSLLQVVTPRYHFVCAQQPCDAEAGAFFQRQPYVTTEGDVKVGAKRLTRLIALCPVNQLKDKKKKKWLHALQLVPTTSAEEVISIPVGSTSNPYLEGALPPSKTPDNATDLVAAPVSNKRGLSQDQIEQLTSQSSTSAQFFYDPRAAERGQRAAAARENRDRDAKRFKHAVEERKECWFCLATPNVERHLIVSIGTEAYLAVPKGAIVPDHVLIVPIAHQASMMQLGPDTLSEIAKFKSVLRQFFSKQGKQAVIFDRNVATVGATHCHLQVVPIPNDAVGSARDVFEREAAKYNIQFDVLSPEEDLKQVTNGHQYFYAEVPVASADGDGNGDPQVVRLLHMIQGKHNMQFGRHAVATILGKPRLANWKFCVVPKPQETEMAQSFKKQFAPFDFTAQDDDE